MSQWLVSVEDRSVGRPRKSVQLQVLDLELDNVMSDGDDMVVAIS